MLLLSTCDSNSLPNLLVRRPLVLRENLLHQAVLHGAAQTKDALVGLGGAEALHGHVADLAFLAEQVVEAQAELAVAGRVDVPAGRGLEGAQQGGALDDEVCEEFLDGGHSGGSWKMVVVTMMVRRARRMLD